MFAFVLALALYTEEWTGLSIKQGLQNRDITPPFVPWQTSKCSIITMQTNVSPPIILSHAGWKDNLNEQRHDGESCFPSWKSLCYLLLHFCACLGCSFPGSRRRWPILRGSCPVSNCLRPELRPSYFQRKKMVKIGIATWGCGKIYTSTYIYIYK